MRNGFNTFVAPGIHIDVTALDDKLISLLEIKRYGKNIDIFASETESI